MKRIRLVGEQLCRTFTTNNLIIETTSTMPTVDIDTERQIIEFKRKIADVRIELIFCFITTVKPKYLSCIKACKRRNRNSNRKRGLKSVTTKVESIRR